MKNLIKEVKRLRTGEIRVKVENRLKEFARLNKKSSDEWFSELCFCLLAANSKGKNAWKIQKELGVNNLCSANASKIKGCIMKNKHRFHNRKTEYIMLARKIICAEGLKAKIKSLIKKGGEELAREWLVENFKGIGYKEASHFLRNLGYLGLAILDRHILRLMEENKYIKEVPSSLTKKKYLEIEDKFLQMAKKAGMKAGELDLYMWYMKVGEVLK